MTPFENQVSERLTSDSLSISDEVIKGSVRHHTVLHPSVVTQQRGIILFKGPLHKKKSSVIFT